MIYSVTLLTTVPLINSSSYRNIVGECGSTLCRDSGGRLYTVIQWINAASVLQRSISEWNRQVESVGCTQTNANCSSKLKSARA